MGRALLFAAAGLAAMSLPAAAQQPGPQENLPQGLVLHVAAPAGETPRVSLGIVRRTAASIALQGRREMQSDCTWSPAGDLPVEADALVPLRDPAGLGGAEQFGDYYATLVNALATANGAASAPGQHACVQRTMTALGVSLLRRAQTVRRPAAPEQ
jgi:hypothetical protein